VKRVVSMMLFSGPQKQQTVLHFGANSRNAEVVKFLLGLGLSVAARDEVHDSLNGICTHPANLLLLYRMELRRSTTLRSKETSVPFKFYLIMVPTSTRFKRFATPFFIGVRVFEGADRIYGMIEWPDHPSQVCRAWES
jgi:hypothetical protein